MVALLGWGSDPNARNKEGDTALHLSRSQAILQALLAFGADPAICNNKVISWVKARASRPLLPGGPGSTNLVSFAGRERASRRRDGQRR